ncbi:MAG: glycerol-3-phosphate acyltransferase [Dehalococcoidia bacterium]|nr:MAG: glycerol-3-phosphate acyltransferase [Dehalococcoidia bacterium]
MTFVLLVLIGYLMGSIPSSYLSMRYFAGTDIRALGTGNATVTAVLMHGGRRPALAALVAEMAKGVLCVLIAHIMVGEVWAALVILVAAVFGCSWSIWLKGGGGQGLTIAMSGLALLNILAVLIMGAFYLLPMAATKRYLLSNRMFRLSVPVVLALWYGSWEYGLAGGLLVMPSFIKQWATGDDVLEARKAEGVSQGSGAS